MVDHIVLCVSVRACMRACACTYCTYMCMCVHVSYCDMYWYDVILIARLWDQFVIVMQYTVIAFPLFVHEGYCMCCDHRA